jgi:hypothetical protein
MSTLDLVRPTTIISRQKLRRYLNKSNPAYLDFEKTLPAPDRNISTQDKGWRIETLEAAGQRLDWEAVLSSQSAKS